MTIATEAPSSAPTFESLYSAYATLRAKTVKAAVRHLAATVSAAIPDAAYITIGYDEDAAYLAQVYNAAWVRLDVPDDVATEQADETTWDAIQVLDGSETIWYSFATQHPQVPAVIAIDVTKATA